MSDSTPAPIGAIVVDGLVQSLVFPHPDGHPLGECFPPGVATPIPEGTIITAGMTWDGKAFGPAPKPEPTPPRVRTAPGYALVKAAKGTKMSGRDLAYIGGRPSVPEDADSVARIAAADGTKPSAWFDAALGIVP